MIVAYASDADGYHTFNVSFQSTNSLLTSLVSEDAVIEASIDQVVPIFEQQGFTNIETATEKVQFAGAEHSCLSLSADVNGVNFYEKVVVIIKNGYIGTFTVASVDSDDTADMLAAATTIK